MYDQSWHLVVTLGLPLWKEHKFLTASTVIPCEIPLAKERLSNKDRTIWQMVYPCHRGATVLSISEWFCVAHG